VTEEHERIIPNLAAYVLGSLETQERDGVEAHLGTCASCAGLVAEYRAVVALMPAGLEPVAPPAAAWSAIQAAARARRTAPSLFSNWLRLSRWPAIAVAAAILVIWNVTLQRELTRRAPGPAPGPEVEALSRRPGRLVILQGTGKPGANARIFVAVDGGGHLAVSGLLPLPRQRTYQLWFMRTGAPAVSGATFGVDPYGRAWVKVTVPASLDDVHAIVITEEHAPGGSSPTGSHLLDSLPWR
jgi:anti-sigma-K factor RskA